MCNILIYFCNIKMKHLQHPDKTFETIKTYACNMGFQRNVILLLGRMEACRCRAQHWRGGRRLCMELDGTASHEAHPPRLLPGASIVEACQLGGGGRGSPDRWRRPQRVGRPRQTGSAVERGHGEHGRARAGSMVEAVARDRAARWRWAASGDG
jgi:hypothetical protein